MADGNTKRTYSISKDEHFMGIALVVAQGSKHPTKKVGACIVNEKNQIVGIGYNSMPQGEDDKFTWDKYVKRHFVCHAEFNAIVNKNASNLNNCTIYVTLHPCNICAQLIIQFGIKKVIYLSDKYADKPDTIAAKTMFEKPGIESVHFKPKRPNLTICFTENVNPGCKRARK